ncbi:hypothetical protein HA402_004374 [Bradysia odoriphaga]|nr:hypothetical protein HA402_004374 [Bradysia odoriphaga]
MELEDTLDALIVGAGFSGLHVLYKLRKEGFKVKIHETGGGIGGTWFWNRYPGARTDSTNTFYQYMQDEIWQGFEWTERCPGQKQLMDYFQHVDKKLCLSKDILFRTKVISAEFNVSRGKWLVKSDNGNIIHTWASHLVLCTGFAERRYTPPFKGLTDFKGEIYHTSLWPDREVNFKGKRVAVVGTGASGVQVVQEIAGDVEHLTVYQRTPNLALPMQQSTIDNQSKWKFPHHSKYQELFDGTRTSFFGLDRNFAKINTMDVPADERRQFYEYLFAEGGFAFILGNYQDVLTSEEANGEAYKFWCEKTRARIDDPSKKDILAPIVPPHPIFAKRCSLEQRYYEAYNRSNIEIIDIRKSPIIEFTSSGIRTDQEGLTEFDVIVLATGFDSVTGGILNINITNGNGETLQDKWKEGTWTNLGLSTADFPNMYFLYGPQAPTALSNGLTCIEIQGDWIVELMVYMRAHNKTTNVATKEAENDWKRKVNDFWNLTLFCRTASWYNGGNVPGKPIEPLNYAGGIPAYIAALTLCAENGYQGFVLS